MRWAWALLALIAVGCAKSVADGAEAATTGSSVSSGKSAKQDPAQVVFDQIRSGFVQLDAITETLAEALSTAKEGAASKDKTKAEACKGIADFMDSAGSYIADYTEPPASFEEFNSKFAEYDDQRLKAIDAANDTLHEVGEAKGFLEDLQAEPKLASDQTTLDLQDLLDQAEKDLREAIQTLGGKVEEPG